MQEITYENVIERLLQALPEFRADEEDIADQRVTLVFEDLTRFLKALVDRDEDPELITRVFLFIEEAAQSSDARVLDAIRYSFLEGLADSPYHLNLTKKHLGVGTKKLLQDAKRFLK
jgi:hypothetical protein